MGLHLCLFITIYLSVSASIFNASSALSEAENYDEQALFGECSSAADCKAGYYCFSCGLLDSKCVRSMYTDQFQLLNGVRALMLDTYDFEGDIWLCHSFGGKCYKETAYGPANETLKEIEAFLSDNPSEIVTLILEDYTMEGGLTQAFTKAGLMKYWFPVSKMPRGGKDWPLVSDMVAQSTRLLVFTSIRSKEKAEGIAYQWNYMVENQYGNGGMTEGKCPNRGESSPMNDTTKSLVLVNHFRTIPLSPLSCEDNSASLLEMLNTCHADAGNRWANFVAVDFYKRSEGGGSFQAVDVLNGELLCGSDDVHDCVRAGSPRAATSYGRD